MNHTTAQPNSENSAAAGQAAAAGERHAGSPAHAVNPAKPAGSAPEHGRAYRIAKKVIRMADKGINWLTILCLIPILLFAIYAVWDSHQVYMAAEPSNYSAYKPENKVSFEQLMEMNTDVFAWLQIYGTHVDYPVAQGKDNDEYINKDVFGTFTLTGSLFLDYRNSRDFTDVNNIIYGHHMERKLMFGELDQFIKAKYFKKHQYGKIYYGDRWHGIEFFAFLQVDAYDTMIYNTGFSGTSGQQSYLNYVKNHAEHWRDVELEAGESYLTLSTCSSDETNGRYILVGRIMDEVPDNPFGEGEYGDDDGFLSEWAESILRKCALALAAIILFIILSWLANKMQRKREKRQAGKVNKTKK